MATPFSYAKIVNNGGERWLLSHLNLEMTLQKYSSGKRIKSSSWSLDIAAVGPNTVVFLSYERAILKRKAHKVKLEVKLQHHEQLK